jgi:hypothetical protein
MEVLALFETHLGDFRFSFQTHIQSPFLISAGFTMNKKPTLADCHPDAGGNYCVS